MKTLLILFCCCLCCKTFKLNRVDRPRRTGHSNEEIMSAFLRETFDPQASQILNARITAEWNYFTDVDNRTKEELMMNATIEESRFLREIWISYLSHVDESTFKNKTLAREVERLSLLGNAALDEFKQVEYANVKTELTEIYSTSRICPYSKPRCDLQKEGLHFSPAIEDIMANSCDYDELLYVWQAWRDQTGAKMKTKYEHYVSLSNDAATANNFTDKGQMWRYQLEIDDVENTLDEIWGQIKPLYDELHMYIYNKLKDIYPREMGMENDGLIPAHLLGNMWAQSWINLRHIAKPFPKIEDCDISEILRNVTLSIPKMFDFSDKFFTSLGLESMADAFDEKLGAVIQKPKDKAILCHPSAWDFMNSKDFRIKMCATVSYDDFITMHQQLGHIQYYMQYKNQPIAFRDGPNPAFHDAISEALTLSVITPKHLNKIGLISNFTESPKAILNLLMDMALEKIAFLPYALVMDKWRWDVFSSKVDPSHWNEHYWMYREMYQKLKPPIPRTTDDFDAGAKFHVVADTQYISYFIARIMEFQIHKSLCIDSEQYSNDERHHILMKCDVYNSKKAGDKLREGMKLGASKHWSEVLKIVANTSELSGIPILEYFKPLYHYLVRYNERYCKK